MSRYRFNLWELRGFPFINGRINSQKAGTRFFGLVMSYYYLIINQLLQEYYWDDMLWKYMKDKYSGFVCMFVCQWLWKIWKDFHSNIDMFLRYQDILPVYYFKPVLTISNFVFFFSGCFMSLWQEVKLFWWIISFALCNVFRVSVYN